MVVDHYVDLTVDINHNKIVDDAKYKTPSLQLTLFPRRFNRRGKK